MSNEEILIGGGLVDERFLDDIPKCRVNPQWIQDESIVLLGVWEMLNVKK